MTNVEGETPEISREVAVGSVSPIRPSQAEGVPATAQLEDLLKPEEIIGDTNFCGWMTRERAESIINNPPEDGKSHHREGH